MDGLVSTNIPPLGGLNSPEQHAWQQFSSSFWKIYGGSSWASSDRSEIFVERAWPKMIQAPLGAIYSWFRDRACPLDLGLDAAPNGAWKLIRWTGIYKYSAPLGLEFVPTTCLSAISLRSSGSFGGRVNRKCLNRPKCGIKSL